jgi:predicted lipid-binding transport protein (Tim44 family)
MAEYASGGAELEALVLLKIKKQEFFNGFLIAIELFQAIENTSFKEKSGDISIVSAEISRFDQAGNHCHLILKMNFQAETERRMENENH